jgi:hypothetical protein
MFENKELSWRVRAPGVNRTDVFMPFLFVSSPQSMDYRQILAKQYLSGQFQTSGRQGKTGR